MILEPAGAAEATVVAEKIRHALLTPFNPRLREVVPTVSMGISIFPEHGEDAEGLLRSADFAMYQAKKLGKDSYLVCPTNPSQVARGQTALRGRKRAR